MSDLRIVYEHVTEPILEGSRLAMPDKTSCGWNHIDCGNVHIAVKSDRSNTIPNSGLAPFLKWIFYAKVNGVWDEIKWGNLTEECKMAAFNAIVAQPQWLPFYKEDMLPPWEDSWFTLAALERM